MKPSPDQGQSVYFGDTSFNLLMQKRIKKVLVICSEYDFFMLEEDGRIDEQIFNEYVALNLRYPPVFFPAHSSKAAMLVLQNESIDLIIEMLSIGDIDAFKMAKQIRTTHPAIPIVVLTNFSREVSLRLVKEDLTAIDYVFSWLGNSDLLLAIIKLIEDKMNAENDILKVGVQTILLVEDSIRYISSYLPNLYRIILEQSKEFAHEALNDHQQMLRRRGRPKILLAKNYQEAVAAYLKYKGHILGVISDVSYKSQPDKRDNNTKAGLMFCKLVKQDDNNMPFLLQSSSQENEIFARELKADFLYKYSKNISNELREYILKQFGFGEFIFRDPITNEEKFVAPNLKSLQELILSVPDDILEYHTRRDDLAKWLNARALFPIAQRFKAAKYDDFKGSDEIRQYIYQTISNFRISKARGIIAEFDHAKFDEYLFFSRIGQGSLGGKARGLAFMSQVLQHEKIQDKYPGIQISVPPTIVLSTDVYDEFMRRNNLYEVVLNNFSDQELLEHFLKSEFPEKIKDDLFAIAKVAKMPIAIRSSSKLEDSFYQPFAGIYNTYMLPPHKNPAIAAGMIEEAIKSVYASVFFKTSKAYMSATSNLIDEEKMGIIIQSVCGKAYDGYFYPTLSGVARSLNYYPIGNEQTTDGIVNLAYGLGKQIVEGGQSLRFSPKYPTKIIQLSSPAQALKTTQKSFMALDLDVEKFIPSTDDKINLSTLALNEAEKHSSFHFAASTYDYENQTIRDGLLNDGKRILTFSPILNHHTFPLASIISDLLEVSSRAMNNPVEIEFAANLDTLPGEPKIFSFLQIRPIVSTDSSITVHLDRYAPELILVYSEKAMGNGRINGVKDIIYVNTNDYKPALNSKIADELEIMNKEMITLNRPYILIGPGRWGSSDPWLGIPVKWNQISQARLIVELGLDNYKVEPSQGTHFFHNLTSFGVGYFTVSPHLHDGTIDMEFLKSSALSTKFTYINRVSSTKPYSIEIDGRNTKGLICRSNS